MQQLLLPFSKAARTTSPSSSSSSNDSAIELAAELVLEKRCQDAFAAVKSFENTHNLSVQSMGSAYTAARPGLVSLLLVAGERLSVRDDVAHDSVLLMDRVMSASLKVRRV